MDHLASHTIITASTAMDTKKEEQSASPDKKIEVDTVPGKSRKGKESKYFSIEDPERSGHKVRVKLALQECLLHEAPDSFLKLNSVYPRSYFPTQMQLSPSSRPARGRFLHDRDDVGMTYQDDELATTTISVPLVEGRETELSVPALGRKKRKRDDELNEMGYRISWDQRKAFPDRLLFLQQALDTCRGRKREALMERGEEVSTIPPVYETRVGKKRWVEVRGRCRGKGTKE